MSGRPNTKWLETMVKKHGSREAVTALMQERGRRGGQNGTTGGFASMDREKHRLASAKGGSISKRGPAKKSKIGTKENKPPVWVDQNSINTPSTLKQMQPCASCKETYAVVELDDMGLCPNCPVEHEVAKQHWYDRFFGVERPF